jgi:PhoH-like ATPase
MDNLKEIEIESIEEIEYDGDVYLLEVENDHNYFVENILSKNCQNLSPKEVKTIASRAGEGTKFVFCGDTYQIDSPWLNSENNGLTYLIQKMRNQKIFAHVNLYKGERSKLSEIVSDLL